MNKSPLRYPGGKSRLVKRIAGTISDFKEYREPFVGGGSLYVYLKQILTDRKFWINDQYTELATFWQKSQTDLEKVMLQVKKWKCEFSEGKELFYFLKDNKDQFNDIQIAAMFFVFNRITFSGTTESGGYSKQAFQGRFTHSSIERLSKIGSILEGLKITNLDYEEVVLAGGEDVFIYLDPPYSNNKKSALYGKGEGLHKNFDHERFAVVLKECPHKWLLTFDDSQFIRELFSFANISSWDMSYGMRNVGTDSTQKEKELFITNYRL